MPTRKISWAGHKSKWSKCKRCDLCHTRDRIVLGKGVIPCDVLFVGEAPGGSENAIGKPFIGPAGKILDRLIQEAEERSKHVSKFFTNLLACIPLDEGRKTTEPPKASVKACADRLYDVVLMTRPKAVVMVGKHSQKWLPKVLDYDFDFSADIIHPAAIARMDAARRPVAEHRTVVVLGDLFTEMFQ